MKKVFFQIMVILSVFVCLACSASGVEGSYDLIEGDSFAESVVLRNDKSGTLITDFGSFSGDYSIKGKELTFTIGGDSVKFIINGDTLTCNVYGYEGTYKKAKDKPRAAANNTTQVPAAQNTAPSIVGKWFFQEGRYLGVFEFTLDNKHWNDYFDTGRILVDNDIRESFENQEFEFKYLVKGNRIVVVSDDDEETFLFELRDRNTLRLYSENDGYFDAILTCFENVDALLSAISR